MPQEPLKMFQWNRPLALDYFFLGVHTHRRLLITNLSMFMHVNISCPLKADIFAYIPTKTDIFAYIPTKTDIFAYHDDT